MSTQLDERTDIQSETSTGAPRRSHIVDRGDSSMSAQAMVLEAMVNGTALTALCGHQWVPTRDPSKFPICEKCLELVEMAKDLSGTNGPIDGIGSA